MIPNRCGYALLRSVIGPQNYRHFLNQSEAKLKSITPWSLAFSRTLHSLPSHWLLFFFFFAFFWLAVQVSSVNVYDTQSKELYLISLVVMIFGLTTIHRQALFWRQGTYLLLTCLFFFSLNFSMKLRWKHSKQTWRRWNRKRGSWKKPLILWTKK